MFGDSQGYRVAVVGGGIAGLVAAHHLHLHAPEVAVSLYDATDRVGGIVQTVVRDGFLIERSADSFIADPPHALDLCRRLGLAEELMAPSKSGRRALVVRDGRLVPVPPGFVIMSPRKHLPLLRSEILSFTGKLRVLEEPLVPPRSPYLDDESVAAFARRRLGAEAYERLIQPLVGGIFTGDPEKLSMAATMPHLWEAESKYGSILRAERADQRGRTRSDSEETSGARYGLFLTLQGGMNILVDALSAALPPGTVKLQHRVTAIDRRTEGWRVTHGATAGIEATCYDAVILAVPARVAAKLLAGVDVRLSEELSGIQSAGATIVCVGYRREQVAHPLDAFGFVVPRVERRQILAGSFLSTKFPLRAPAGSVLMRIFLGGALQSELVDLPDEAILGIVERELHELLGVVGPPEVVEIARWHGAMPQYHVGHLHRVERIERLARAAPGLALAGNAYHGVGIAQCVRGGELAAGRVLDFLRTRNRRG
jgi:oxygen-dependent protoporphyrinogen oxidase